MFDMPGGHPALDLTNTVSYRGSDRQSDDLKDYGRLLDWTEQAGLLPPGEIRVLRKEAQQRPSAAAAALRKVAAIRERIYEVFAAEARGCRLPAEAFDALNANVASALSALRVVRTGEGFSWAWATPAVDLSRMIPPIVRSAAELLTSDDVRRVRVCCDDSCIWLFLDRSRSGTRRWCDMKVCGNRAKARRHYRRSKTGSGRSKESSKTSRKN